MSGCLSLFSSPTLSIYPQSFHDPTHSSNYNYNHTYNYNDYNYNHTYNYNNYNYNHTYNYNNNNNNNDDNTNTNISNSALASQSFSAPHYANGHFFSTDHGTYISSDTSYFSASHTSSLAQSVQTPVLDPAIPNITADLDAMFIFSPAPGGLTPEVPAPQRAAFSVHLIGAPEG
ncbi:hypothetical protein BGZ59_009323 [Podila verticillata]|nr:hypothetical protein BGZ59_009323 [Podila verticillata]